MVHWHVPEYTGMSPTHCLQNCEIHKEIPICKCVCVYVCVCVCVYVCVYFAVLEIEKSFWAVVEKV
jgi:hypothetical protein